MGWKEGTRRYGSTVTRSISGSSAQSAAITGYDEVRLYNGDTAVCFVAWGSSPTATTSSFPIAPGTDIHIQVDIDSKIAVIGTAGTLYITGCT